MTELESFIFWITVGAFWTNFILTIFFPIK